MKRINFKLLEIENFLSIGDTTVSINFKTGLNIITGVNHDKEDSKNGVGKSTIADSIYFCLFGTTIRELKKEDIINNINKKKCRVKLEFDILENNVTNVYSIERCISPNKLHVIVNGVDTTKSTALKSTEDICNIIGATPDVFKNAVIMTVNGTIPFMAQKKVEKRKFCEGLFNLGVFQDMLLEERKRYNETKTNIEIETVKYEEVKNTLAVYMDQKKKRDEYRNSRITKLLERKENNLIELKKLKESIQDVNVNDIEMFNSNIELLTNNAEKLQNNIQTHIKLIATNEEQIKNIKQKINTLNELGDVCDKCERPVTEHDKKEVDKKLGNYITKIKELKIETDKNIENQKELENNKIKCIKAITKQNNNINNLNTIIETNKNNTAKIDQLNIWNKQINVDIEILEEDKNEFDTLLNDNNTRLIALKNIITELNKRLIILDSIKHIVSEEGVKSYIIKKLLKILNGKLTYYLNKLDAPCRFKFNEYFDEQIINEKGQECSYNNFSSGERKRIDLAILFTFMDIRRLQGNTSINIAFYDEILDTSLDDKGIESFLEIVNERIDKYNEACYIISHKTVAINSNVNDVIFLEKRNGFTTINNIIP